MEVERVRMKKIFLVLCMCLSSVMCAAQVKTQGTADEELASCVKEGDVSCVALALGAGANANATTKDGWAVLTVAAEGKSADVVKLLLSAGADVNRERPGGGTALCRAALFGHDEIAEALLMAGAKTNIVCDGDHGDTPLLEAMRGATLASMPDDFREEVAGASDGDAAKDEDEASNDDKKKYHQVLNTPGENFLAVARLLIAHGADVNAVARCGVGETALMYAAVSANVEMVETLLARGAQVNNGGPVLTREFGYVSDKAKLLALPALSKGQSAMLAWFEKTKAALEKIRQLLKAAGAKEPEKDESEDGESDGQTLEELADEAFTSTILKNDVKDLERLIKAYKGHPLGAAALAGALRTAENYNRAEMVKLLLAWGADPNAGRL